MHYLLFTSSEIAADSSSFSIVGVYVGVTLDVIVVIIAVIVVVGLVAYCINKRKKR